ncbi:zinc-binding dehydrogenase [Nonomuraea sp. NPDC050153]|uniref:zinc-binding dehydrogenase n=1 Tax=Nonomuraea sp. NPDC050153 TaxID=3364359 RepID=UPI0037AC6CCE
MPSTWYVVTVMPRSFTLDPRPPTIPPRGKYAQHAQTSWRPARPPRGSEQGLGQTPDRGLEPRHPADDLAHLLALVATGGLSVEIGRHGSWEDLDDAKAAQLGGAVTGKIVLQVGHTP